MVCYLVQRLVEKTGIAVTIWLRVISDTAESLPHTTFNYSFSSILMSTFISLLLYFIGNLDADLPALIGQVRPQHCPGLNIYPIGVPVLNKTKHIYSKV